MRSIFVNLPVTDLRRSVGFLEALGFTKNPQFSDETAACMALEPNIFVMLLTHEKFSGFINGPIADPRVGTDHLLCLSAESREEVGALKARALAAGAGSWKDDTDYGWMLGASFQDPDGHVWELVWMDPAAAAGGPPAETAAA